MSHRTRDILIVMLVLLLIGIVFYSVNISFTSSAEVKDYINGFGAWGPLVVIGLIILEVILAPIPGVIISVGSGAAFGFLRGSLYTYIGNIIGTCLAFWLSRRFGRPLAKRLIKQDKLEKYDRFIRNRGLYGIWLAYIFPVFPTDIVSFVVGLSSLKFRRFLKIILIGFIPNMILLNFFGDSLITNGLGLSTILIGSLLIIIFLIAFMYMNKE